LRIESVWRDLEANRVVGTLKRVDEAHPSAFYATRDFAGRRGLLLWASVAPIDLPKLEALDVNVIALAGEQWQVFIWLKDPEFAHLFSLLCDDLMESSRSLPPADVPTHVAVRLTRWRRLFAVGKSNVLPANELRGLIGELAVLNDSFDWMSPADAVTAWQGPLDAPQDFAFAGAVVEVKTVGPTALRARVGSTDQLDAPYASRLVLAIVIVAPAAIGAANGISVPQYIEGIRGTLQAYPLAADEFESRLRAAGYQDDPDYGAEWFRIDGVRYFSVSREFPRIVRSDLMPGIYDAAYEVELSAITSFETVLWKETFYSE
jgi:hypothetical protein